MQQTRRRFIATSAAALATSWLSGQLVTPVQAQAVGRKAPSWDILEWINGDGGNVDTLRGKVIIIDFFQLWCPGCNKFSGPLMTHWQDKFSDQIAAGQLALVKIHTVFEGRNYQTVKRLKTYVEEKGITLPVGVDRHVGDRRIPETMQRYQTRGTPEMVIIDANGLIQFQEFGGFDHAPVEQMIVEMINKART